MKMPLSGSQTVGPYYLIGLAGLCSTEVPAGSEGEAVVIEGRMLDANRAPIPDGFLEIWQADGHGRYGAGEPAESIGEAKGFARVATDGDGRFRFRTIRPGAVAYDGARRQAPHLLVLVFMRGLLRNLVTRMYFPDEMANASDPVLQLVPEGRRHTLIARRGDEAGTLRWEIVLRDQEAMAMEETVFFAW